MFEWLRPVIRTGAISIGGTAASVGAHALLLALFWAGWVFSDEPKGMLLPAFVPDAGEFISWSAPPEKAGRCQTGDVTTSTTASG